MFDSYLNHLFLTFWTGVKKVGPHKEINLSRECETYGDAVFDIKWKLNYIYENGKTSHTVTIAERANKWDLKKIIRRVEKEVLPQKINSLIRQHEGANSVK